MTSPLDPEALAYFDLLLDDLPENHGGLMSVPPSGLQALLAVARDHARMKAKYEP